MCTVHQMAVLSLSLHIADNYIQITSDGKQWSITLRNVKGALFLKITKISDTKKSIASKNNTFQQALTIFKPPKINNQWDNCAKDQCFCEYNNWPVTIKTYILWANQRSPWSK